MSCHLTTMDNMEITIWNRAIKNWYLKRTLENWPLSCTSFSSPHWFHFLFTQSHQTHTSVIKSTYLPDQERLKLYFASLIPSMLWLLHLWSDFLWIKKQSLLFCCIVDWIILFHYGKIRVFSKLNSSIKSYSTLWRFYLRQSSLFPNHLWFHQK